MPTITVIQPTITEEKIRIQRVAAYCRVSSDSEDQLHSFAAQMRHYTQAFSGSNTEILVDVYADEGISGVTATKRTEFQRMLKDCRSGKIDRIVTKSISRFARNTKECLETVRELRSLGVTIHFEKEGIDTANTADEFMITLMGGLAQEESVSISQNMQWAIEKRMQNGTFTAAHAPYGYVKIGNTLQINEAEAQVVRQIFQLFLSGEGILSICRILNDQQINRRSKISHQQKKLCDITKSEEDDRQTDRLKEAASTIENAPDLLTDFDAELFEAIIEKITVTDRKTLKLHLHGGLTFMEEIT